MKPKKLRKKKFCHKHGSQDHAYIPSKDIYVCEFCVQMNYYHHSIAKEFHKTHNTKDLFFYAGLEDDF